MGKGIWTAAWLSAALCAGPAVAAGTAWAPPAYCKQVMAPPETIPGAVSETYRTIGDRTLRIHLFMPETGDRPRPAALFFFGGGFRTGDARSFAEHARLFAARGYVAAIADYRILCRDNVTPVAGVEDADRAYAWLRAKAWRLGIDPRRIVTVGGSAGGFLAATAASHARRGAKPAAVVLFNPVTDLQVGPWAERMTAGERRATALAGPALKGFPPTIVLHGTGDTTVPFATAEAFCARLDGLGGQCRMEAYPGLNHSFYMIPVPAPGYPVSPKQDAIDRTFAFLDSVETLRPRGR